MSEHFFGLHAGHLTIRAQRIAERHRADHVNYTEPGTGVRRGWFWCANRGEPFDSATARTVMDAVDRAGGIEGLLVARDRARDDG